MSYDENAHRKIYYLEKQIESLKNKIDGLFETWPEPKLASYEEIFGIKKVPLKKTKKKGKKRK